MEAQAGIATPTGVAGASVGLALPFLVVSAGAGYNFAGLQKAVAVRVRLSNGHGEAGTFGVAYSVGPFELTRNAQYGAFAFMNVMNAMGESRLPDRYRWDAAQWLTFSFGFEGRGRSALYGRVFAGVALMLNDGAGVASQARDSVHRWWTPTTTLVSLGGAFGAAVL